MSNCRCNAPSFEHFRENELHQLIVGFLYHHLMNFTANPVLFFATPVRPSPFTLVNVKVLPSLADIQLCLQNVL